MKTIRSAMIPVAVLWEYREFKRDEVSAPNVPYFQSYTIDEVTDHVGLHGMEPVELSIIKDKAMLTDGNHRIVAARRLGFSHIPVLVTVYFGTGHEVFYNHTLERFKLITKELELELKKLFLGE